jgi:hypothetical protein
VDIAAARGAHVTCTVAYGSRHATFTVVADGGGYATIRFKVTGTVRKGSHVQAAMTVTAQLGRVRKQATATFTVQG